MTQKEFEQAIGRPLCPEEDYNLILLIIDEAGGNPKEFAKLWQEPGHIAIMAKLAAIIRHFEVRDEGQQSREMNTALRLIEWSIRYKDSEMRRLAYELGGKDYCNEYRDLIIASKDL